MRIASDAASTPASVVYPGANPHGRFQQQVQTQYQPLFGHVTRSQGLNAELKLQESPTTQSPRLRLLRPRRIGIFIRVSTYFSDSLCGPAERPIYGVAHHHRARFLYSYQVMIPPARLEAASWTVAISLSLKRSEGFRKREMNMSTFAVFW